jgi:hypothetical protein
MVGHIGFGGMAGATGGGPSGTDWPGKPGGNNPVGYAATPATAPSRFVGTWPGAWPGTFANWAATSNHGERLNAYCSRVGNIVSGTATNPTIVKFLDFDGGPNTGSPNYNATPQYITADGTTGGAALNYVTFVGCRFTCNGTGTNTTSVDLYNANNVAFIYCTFAPRAQLLTSPPQGSLGTSWPSASAMSGKFLGDVPGQPTGNGSWNLADYQTYCTSAASSFQYTINPENTILLVDHCDLWCGTAPINLLSSHWAPLLGSQTFTDNWMHDYADSITTPPGGSGNYHDDGIGFPTGNLAPVVPAGSVILIQHNTFASLGNTEFICNQETAGNNCWNVSTAYGSGAIVFDPNDGNNYQSSSAVTGGSHPAANPSKWTLLGVGNYHHFHCINNYFSGQDRPLNPAMGKPLSSDLVFTDNVVGTDLVMNSFVYNPTTGEPQYSNPALFAHGNSLGNTWQRNKVQIVSGDTWSSTHVLQWKNQPGYNYPVGGVVMSATDNRVYVALQANGPANGGAVDPANNANPTVWQQQTTAQVAAGYYLWADGSANINEW